tara:strand:+ start:430 stop:678 length:249 start_codon:yes stop_codon:yes gene_type:complete
MKKILYFSATWCGPCKNLRPIMESLSNQMIVQFVDIDSSPDLAAEYGVTSIPTLVFEKDGRPVKRESGVLTESQVKNIWNQL